VYLFEAASDPIEQEPFMNKLTRLFTDHPESVGETYWEHARHAATFAAAMLQGAFACLIHALVPALCRCTGSQIIADLHTRMVVNRRGASKHGVIAAFGADGTVDERRVIIE
jgi:hypothetical protein